MTGKIEQRIKYFALRRKAYYLPKQYSLCVYKYLLFIMDGMNKIFVSVLKIKCYLICLLAFKFTDSVIKIGSHSKVTEGLYCAC